MLKKLWFTCRVVLINAALATAGQKAPNRQMWHPLRHIPVSSSFSAHMFFGYSSVKWCTLSLFKALSPASPLWKLPQPSPLARLARLSSIACSKPFYSLEIVALFSPPFLSIALPFYLRICRWAVIALSLATFKCATLQISTTKTNCHIQS